MTIPASSNHRPPLIALVGPTASGKTDLAIALARELDCEIVGADSRQIYRGLAIGTAQPTLVQRAAVPHHLIGTVEPDEPFGLALYLDRARAAVEEISLRGRQVLVVGGTGQYVWALIEQWNVPRVEPCWALREELEAVAKREGPLALHLRLGQVDPVAARGIHVNNVRRVIRALEVYALTGAPISEQRGRTPQPAIILGVTLGRDLLYERIDRRVTAMYAHGLLHEVRVLERRGYHRNLPSMAGIGYPEAWSVLAGELSEADAVLRTQRATHRLVRQQGTWFRPTDERIAWLDAAAGGLAERATELVRASLAEAAGSRGNSDAVHKDARHGE